MPYSPFTVKVVSREVIVPSPAPGVCVQEGSYYARGTGDDLVSVYQYMKRSDTIEVGYRRFSNDNGKTWSQPRELITGETRPEGVLRRYYYHSGYIDPHTGRLLEFRNEGLLPHDNPMEGVNHWRPYYTVSEDGGRTFKADGPIAQTGGEFGPLHPWPGLYIGRNGSCIGGPNALTLHDGTILVPCYQHPLGPDGNYHNPGGGLRYHEVVILHGNWRPDGSLNWLAARPIQANPERTTRGFSESTIALLNDGRILLVMRGSNHRKPHLPSHKWYSISGDAGITWSEATPWTYEDGTDFYSPASWSQLLPHSSGRLLWLGNIVPVNPNGNEPRYPLVMGEVDKATGHLIRASVQPVDDRGPDDSPMLHLSNFFAREDRATGQITLHLSRWFAASKETADWTADALVYRISL